jgi:hypothetical protein
MLLLATIRSQDNTEKRAMLSKPFAGILAVLLCAAASAGAQELRRSTVWDLKLGQPATSQPAVEEFRGFACGSNGGPPRQKLSGWGDFARCRAEPSGLHEIYFEYDDEFEYIARAKDLEMNITRWAGTTEARFPVIVSALFDDSGVLQGIRLVSDPRADYQDHITEANLRKRAEAYVLGGVLASRYGIDAARDCQALPPAEGESAVGALFVKQSCAMDDQANSRRVLLRANFYRKPGQSGVNPQLSTQLTQGQFESSARLEILQLQKP